MARVITPMQITAVDSVPNLFQVTDLVPSDLLQQILATDWLNVPHSTQPCQETWPRRRIELHDLSWGDQWTTNQQQIWFRISTMINMPLLSHHHGHTVFWLDHEGFDCPIHTDGALPGAMQMYWIGHSEQGTCFYHDSQGQQVRKQFESQANTGYIMTNPLNNAESTGLFHGMLNPVPVGTFRLTSYTLLKPNIT